MPTPRPRGSGSTSAVDNAWRRSGVWRRPVRLRRLGQWFRDVEGVVSHASTAVLCAAKAPLRPWFHDLRRNLCTSIIGDHRYLGSTLSRVAFFRSRLHRDVRQLGLRVRPRGDQGGLRVHHVSSTNVGVASVPRAGRRLPPSSGPRSQHLVECGPDAEDFDG